MSPYILSTAGSWDKSTPQLHRHRILQHKRSQRQTKRILHTKGILWGRWHFWFTTPSTSLLPFISFITNTSYTSNFILGLCGKPIQTCVSDWAPIKAQWCRIWVLQGYSIKCWELCTHWDTWDQVKCAVREAHRGPSAHLSKQSPRRDVSAGSGE